MAKWLIVPYAERESSHFGSIRYLAIDDYSDLEGFGSSWGWDAIEVAGNVGIVKLWGNNAELTAILEDNRFKVFPVNKLSDTFENLPPNALGKMRAAILALGYDVDTLDEHIPSLEKATLGDVLKFLSRYMHKVRKVGGKITADGAIVILPNDAIEALNKRINDK